MRGKRGSVQCCTYIFGKKYNAVNNATTLYSSLKDHEIAPEDYIYSKKRL